MCLIIFNFFFLIHCPLKVLQQKYFNTNLCIFHMTVCIWYVHAWSFPCHLQFPNCTSKCWQWSNKCRNSFTPDRKLIAVHFLLCTSKRIHKSSCDMVLLSMQRWWRSKWHLNVCLETFRLWVWSSAESHQGRKEVKMVLAASLFGTQYSELDLGG